ncbi:MAG: alpha/beta hydrolase family protein [Gaiellaceae bacterium]
MIRALFVAVCCALAVGLGEGASQAAQQPVVALRVFHFVDATRIARFRNGTTRPRTLVTYVRYPNAARSPLPLVVFGHGFAVTPGLYAQLLDAWARAGYVVAAPLFPVENANAPGGPDESDLANQPGDMSVVITQLLAESANARSPLHGLIDPARIAVAGQSDGGETALAVAYDSRFVDRRVRAAVILSGARIPGGHLEFGAGKPPLLAVQGTDDPINPPRYTNAFFEVAGRPKFLLTLLGAGHLPPYTTNAGQLAVVERVTVAFLGRYLAQGSLRALLAAGDAPKIGRLTARP